MSKLFQLALLMLLCTVFTQVAANEPLRVVISIKPIHSLVAGIMQGVAEPLLLMDGSVPPWEHRPDAVQMEVIANADLVIWSGTELEPLLGAAIAQLPDSANIMEILASEEMKVLPSRGDKELRDAWFWLDTRNMLILLDEITRELMRLDPENSHRYERNRGRMLNPLIIIDRQMEFGYKDVGSIPVFFYHDTHHYFEQAYAMKVAGTVASPPAAPAAEATGLLALKSWIAEAPVHCLFTEASFSEPHLELLLADSGVTPVELDSLGSALPPGADLYIKLMRENFGAISACLSAFQQGAKSSSRVDSEAIEARRYSEKLRPGYVLMNQYEQTVTHEDFPGHFQLINFGYTFCPDICPTTLADMGYVMELLGEDAQQVQPIFITIDPQRDTTEVLKRYTAYFHPRLLGLSGSPEMTARVAEKFRARYEKVMAKDGDPLNYSMDHTASLYLLGRNGEFITKFAFGMSPQEVAERLREYIQR
jgi:cytochrome oxidase Cu insertion factor (SCO1/SenC/PrrC family)/ABC-type Zn2+ transport system substrate-binding protein/surface adhesin